MEGRGEAVCSHSCPWQNRRYFHVVFLGDKQSCVMPACEQLSCTIIRCLAGRASAMTTCPFSGTLTQSNAKYMQIIAKSAGLTFLTSVI